MLLTGEFEFEGAHTSHSRNANLVNSRESVIRSHEAETESG